MCYYHSFRLWVSMIQHLKLNMLSLLTKIPCHLIVKAKKTILGLSLEDYFASLSHWMDHGLNDDRGVWPLTTVGSVWSLIRKWFQNYISWLKLWELLVNCFYFRLSSSTYRKIGLLHCFIQWKIRNTTTLKSKAILQFCVKNLQTFAIYSLIAHEKNSIYALKSVFTNKTQCTHPSH